MVQPPSLASVLKAGALLVSIVTKHPSLQGTEPPTGIYTLSGIFGGHTQKTLLSWCKDCGQIQIPPSSASLLTTHSLAEKPISTQSAISLWALQMFVDDWPSSSGFQRSVGP